MNACSDNPGPPRAMKRKQFVKGMQQIAQEGAIQIFEEPNAIGVRNMVENKVDFQASRNVIIAALILCLTIGIEYSAAGAIRFSIGSVNISLSGLAIASIVGIVLNAVLPGKDLTFADKPKDAATLGRY